MLTNYIVKDGFELKYEKQLKTRKRKRKKKTYLIYY